MVRFTQLTKDEGFYNQLKPREWAHIRIFAYSPEDNWTEKNSTICVREF